MNIALWGIQSLLALAFFGSGATKLAKDRATLLKDKRMGWANDFSSFQIKMIGVAEVIGAIGLIVPLAFGAMRVVVPVAAAGLGLMMAAAVMTHLRRKENPAPAAVLGVLVACLAVFRFIVR